MNGYKNLSFRVKIIIPMSLFALMILAISIVGATNIAKLKNSVDEVAKTRIPGMVTAFDARSALHKVLIAERTVLFTDVESENYRSMVEQHQDNLDEIEDVLAVLKDLLTENRYVTNLSKLEDAFNTWKSTTNEVISNRNQDTRFGRNLAIDISAGASATQFEELEEILETLVVMGRVQTEAITLESSILTESTRMSLLVFSAVALIICILLATVFPTVISKRLISILNMIEDISKGEADLTKRLHDDGKDEIGRIAQSYNEVINRIHDLIVDIKDISSSIVLSSNDINSGHQGLSQRAEEQASSLEETATSMEEMTVTVKNNAESAHKATLLANNARADAVKGGDVIQRTDTAMDEINHASARIADITSTIDSIAFQTNLLALNAAVEAARAGEQGRGFAVVASEVRNLAQNSADAAKEIKNIIQDTLDKVKNGSNLVAESGATLNEIVTSVTKVADIVSDIASASNEQASGIEQVNAAIIQMDDMTQQNAALVEEATATSASMKHQATTLDHKMNFFKVDANSSLDNNIAYLEATKPIHSLKAMPQNEDSDSNLKEWNEL